VTTRSPWALEYARRPDEYVLGTAPSAFARRLRSLLAPGVRVLELGCGEGRDSVFFASCGCDVTAVDVSAAGLRKAERLARTAGVEVRWVHCDAARYLPKGTFDFVYSCGAIHYVPCRLRARLLARLKAATSPTGVHAHLVFTDHTVYVEWNERIDYFRAGELAQVYADWQICWNGHGTIACDRDGRPHLHGVEELIARRTPASGG
jgi:tellurite methyltransferase